MYTNRKKLFKQRCHTFCPKYVTKGNEKIVVFFNSFFGSNY